MAYTRELTTKSGETVYEIVISRGRGARPISRRWRPDNPDWSQRTIQRELIKYAADLERQVKNGEIHQRKEDKAQREQIEREKAQALTVSAFSEIWLKRTELEVSPGSLIAYRNALKYQILPSIGSQPLQNVTSPMLASLLADVQKGYSNSTTSKVHSVLSQLFGLAQELGAISTNPMRQVKKPKRKREDKPSSPQTLSVEQIQTIRQQLQDENLWTKAFISFLIDSGCRLGEACAVQWRDVDFSTGAVNIERSISNSTGLGSTKTRKSRLIFIGRDTLSILKQLRQEQSRICLSQWTFSRPGQTEPVMPTAAGKVVTRLGEKVGIPLHPHLFRHSFISNALEAGASVLDVAAQAGHSSSAMTLNVYGHSSAEGQQRAAETFREAIGENK